MSEPYAALSVYNFQGLSQAESSRDAGMKEFWKVCFFLNPGLQRPLQCDHSVRRHMRTMYIYTHIEAGTTTTVHVQLLSMLLALSS
jgi:hypothetical protein